MFLVHAWAYTEDCTHVNEFDLEYFCQIWDSMYD